MPAITSGTPLHSFVDAIRKAFSDVFSQALGSPWSVEINTQDAPTATDTLTSCFSFSASGGLQGGTAVFIRQPDAILLAQKFLSEPPEEASELSNERKEAVEELLRQVTGLAATSLKVQFGEVKLEVTTGDAPAGPGVAVVLLASEASVGSVPLELRFNTELLASVSSSPAAVSTPVSPVVSSPAPEPGPATKDINLDLLLGVNLSLTLRFGQRVLTLREILDLNSGAVIELDRQIQEPADLLLGDKLIARGEVVIVDGNYGIRITEVTDPSRRIEARTA